MLSRIMKVSGAIKRIKLHRARQHVTSTRPLTVGRHTIELPPGHLLDIYKISHEEYDVHLQRIGRIIAGKYPGCWAIDIGANIGDSAAAISAEVDIHTICIEGDPTYSPVLCRNAQHIGPFVHIIAAYVGASEGTVTHGQIQRQGGTASIVSIAGVPPLGRSAGLTVPIAPLEILLAPFAAERFKFLKIDTDGFDFTILESCHTWVATRQPVILFECDTSFPDCSEARAVETLQRLHRTGYAHLAVFDNYGKLMSATSRDVATVCEHIRDLQQSRREARGIQYVDIYAFPEKDVDIFSEFVATQA